MLLASSNHPFIKPPPALRHPLILRGRLQQDAGCCNYLYSTHSPFASVSAHGNLSGKALAGSLASLLTLTVLEALPLSFTKRREMACFWDILETLRVHGFSQVAFKDYTGEVCVLRPACAVHDLHVFVRACMSAVCIACCTSMCIPMLTHARACQRSPCAVVSL